jgi:membrane protease YdiL (CAAX protease family)
LHWDFAFILGILAFVIPVMGRRRVRALLALPDTTKLDRLSIYASTIAFQWLAAALILWRTIRHGITPAQLGISLGHGYLAYATTIVLSLLLLLNQIASARRIKSDSGALRSATAQLALKVFPRDGIERLAFSALVTTVAVCEEFIYRGFAQYVFLDWSRFFLIGILGSAFLFSFAHLYQGKRGLVSTFAVGLLFSGIRAWSGSLVPTIAAHFVADLSIGLLAPRHIQEALRQTRNLQEEETAGQATTSR